MVRLLHQIPIPFTRTSVSLTGAPVPFTGTSHRRLTRHNLLVCLAAIDVVAHVIVLGCLRWLTPLEGCWWLLRVEGGCGGHLMVVGFGTEGGEGEVVD